MSDMNLPEDRRCKDCVYFPHCSGILSINPMNTACDFSPSRFVETEVSRLRSQLKTAVDGLKNTRNALAGDHHAMALEYAEEALKKLKGEEVSK